MRLQLLVIAGPDKDRDFTLQEGLGMMLGKAATAQYRLHDLGVARSHCEIILEDGQVTVADFDSTDGTFINGKKIEKAVMNLGDVLAVGGSQLRLHSDDFPLNSAAGSGTGSAVASPSKPATIPKAVQKLSELGGKTLGHFELGPVLGSGHASMVFQAKDQKTGKKLAIKVIFSEFGQKEEELQRFIKAMKVVLPLHHPNLVTAFGAGKSGTHCWVALELVEGPNLAQLIAQPSSGPNRDWKPAYEIALDIGRALVYAHEQDALHGCVYPENILVADNQKAAKLNGLMLARAIESATAPEISQPGKQEENLVYMSPERTHGLKKIDFRSDLYSLGASVYAYLTGRSPIQGETLLEKITRVRQHPPSRPSQFVKGLPPQFETILMKLLAKKPDERYQTAQELVDNLEGVTS
ncbi:MAG TPA: FHA domain-containing serine/threonine-protein kinase [Gemmataceae bacterium]|jgi:serine/threonine protein kinase|nr:FHA domain-containing serine/threonine-protein kinase [Gemmataceae bacterium]